MLITCPYCGPRDLAEFSYQGDASRVRPDQGSTDQQAWNAYVFQRPNPAGPHREYWQHAGGCRSHLLVVRDTTTHEVLDTAFARAAPSTEGATTAAPAPRQRAPRKVAK